MSGARRHARNVLAALALVQVGGCADPEREVPPAGGAGGTGGVLSGSGGGASSAGSGAGGGGGVAPVPPPNVLLFSKTTGFRHDSIEDAVAALTALGTGRGWHVEATEDAGVFTEQQLAAFDVVVWLLTSGDVLDETQQAAFEGFIAAGNGYVGVHSASDTEYEWPWYGELVGAYFQSHPAIQTATIRVERPGHLATTGLDGATWMRADEWYDFGSNPRDGVQVLLSVDEASYTGGTMGDHPIAWYKGHAGGRSLYTALGHTKESWAEPAFLSHVAGGIEWAGGAEDPRVVLAELDGVAEPGAWDAHEYAAGTFEYEVGADALLMTDAGGANQHLVRRGISVDPARPYAVEALFTIHGSGGSTPDMNSFCFNLNVAGPDGDLAPPSTWAMNLDVSASPPAGVMKHMGFVDGVFGEMGQTSVDWAWLDVEYLLRVEVNSAADGSFAPDRVTTTVLEAGVERERFEVDYAGFAYQPPAAPVRIGVNTHGTDWTMRGLRVHYLDGPADQ